MEHCESAISPPKVVSPAPEVAGPVKIKAASKAAEIRNARVLVIRTLNRLRVV